VSEEGCTELSKESASTDFVAHAFVHLKTIGFSADCRPLLDKANVQPDDGVIDLTDDMEAFIAQARTRLWEREANVRLLS